MNTSDIIEEAKKRLAEIEVETAKLRAMIAAAEGKAPIVPFAPLSAFIYPAGPITPDHVHHPVWPLDQVTCSPDWVNDPDPLAVRISATPIIVTIVIGRNGQHIDPNQR